MNFENDKFETDIIEKNYHILKEVNERRESAGEIKPQLVIKELI